MRPPGVSNKKSFERFFLKVTGENRAAILEWFHTIHTLSHTHKRETRRCMQALLKLHQKVGRIVLPVLSRKTR